jgi:hypothetical protein
MLTQDINFISEALLAICESDANRPFFDDATLERKLKEAKTREPLWMQFTVRRPEDPLMHNECQAMIERANLTPRQNDVMTQRLAGDTFEMIGRRRGSTKQGAQKIFLQALKKIKRACHVYPYTGLSDVYQWETRRGRPFGSR